jgi:YspA, cpYpsA-related SLOG family
MAEIILSVSGSRLFLDYELFCKTINEFIGKYGQVKKIVHGGAKGADTLAEKWAKEHNIETMIFRPDYGNQEKIQKYGKHVWGRIAPLERNKDIVLNGSHLLAFPLDETLGPEFKSNGTKSAISHAKKMNKVTMIVSVKPTENIKIIQ